MVSPIQRVSESDCEGIAAQLTCAKLKLALFIFSDRDLTALCPTEYELGIFEAEESVVCDIPHMDQN